ncbi:hypothetical protein BPAE_0252g00090 [Botrytis paeoniae]|uniref:Uncharacterized protein n=1 Tax=Botrytis paeoniae TaxID=278948 RepID=A0A4Z1F9B6_9HELO|nr:hypothetical protein BPAE_0252g00090 [Botrytis paeoniae]
MPILNPAVIDEKNHDGLKLEHQPNQLAYCLLAKRSQWNSGTITGTENKVRITLVPSVPYAVDVPVPVAERVVYQYSLALG